MINWLRKKFCGPCTCFKEDERARRNATIISKTLVATLLADLSVETLESLVLRAKENQQKVGHHDYESLAELYCSIMRMRKQSLKSYNANI